MKFSKFSVDGIEQIAPPEIGRGAFESFRLHGGKVFLLDKHFDRLKKSLKALEIAWDDDRKKYYSWIVDLCRDLPSGKDAFVRLAVSSSKGKSSIIIFVAYIDFFSPKDYRAEIIDKPRLVLPEYFAKTGFRIKSTDYISANQTIRKSAGLKQGVDGILLTPDGYAAEGLTSNVFWSKDGKLFTPPLKTGILAGTMRSYLIDKHDIEEKLVKSEELELANEIILTSGASYLRPLAEINGIKKPGASGPAFVRLYEQLQKDIDESTTSL